MISICISSYNRTNFFRRVLWGIANRPPACDFEVVVADDGSTEDILGLLKQFSSRMNWTLVRFDSKEFEEKTGIKKLYGNPSVTNNIAFKHARGEYIVMQGNEVIPWHGCYQQLLGWMDRVDHAFSTTFDLNAGILSELDPYGSNLSQRHIDIARATPLQAAWANFDVTNYLSMTKRWVWEELGGYDERYYHGISCEDSDFIRRARKLPNFKEMMVDSALSFHQYHGGMTIYYEPTPRHGLTKDQWYEYIELNRAIYHEWDETHHNPQPWPWGTYGVKEVIHS